MHEKELPAPIVHRKKAVVALTGLSATTLWRLTRRGEFPEPIRLSAGAVGWLDSEISAWLADRAASRSMRRHAGSTRVR